MSQRCGLWAPTVVEVAIIAVLAARTATAELMILWLVFMVVSS